MLTVMTVLGFLLTQKVQSDTHFSQEVQKVQKVRVSFSFVDGCSSETRPPITCHLLAKRRLLACLFRCLLDISLGLCCTVVE